MCHVAQCKPRAGWCKWNQSSCSAFITQQPLGGWYLGNSFTDPGDKRFHLRGEEAPGWRYLPGWGPPEHYAAMSLPNMTVRVCLTWTFSLYMPCWCFSTMQFVDCVCKAILRSEIQIFHCDDRCTTELSWNSSDYLKLWLFGLATKHFFPYWGSTWPCLACLLPKQWPRTWTKFNI